MSEFKFKPSSPKQWSGRYRRPTGGESAYHVDTKGIIEVRWSDGENKYTCPAIVTSEVHAMAKSVNTAKLLHAGQAGGSFVINEFGQVISAIQNSRLRLLVGEVSGTLWFEDPWRDGAKLTLNAADGLRCGDEWKLPYLGLQYQLSAGSEIYFWREDEERSGKEALPRPDRDLIELLREVRPNGAVRFIVNHYGLVLTKKPIGRDQWQAVFVGKINLEKWFIKEN
jgi:hypothetical protein